tara:strand:- start:24749 stop:25090 length:342 start_codon:yes stop_codon:yes gene_type:complete
VEKIRDGAFDAFDAAIGDASDGRRRASARATRDVISDVVSASPSGRAVERAREDPSRPGDIATRIRRHPFIRASSRARRHVAVDDVDESHRLARARVVSRAFATRVVARVARG